MSKKPQEINDNEIRIISASPSEHRRRFKRFLRCYLPVIAIILTAAVCVAIHLSNSSKTEEYQIVAIHQAATEESPAITQEKSLADVRAYTVVRDTIISHQGLLILSPENASPRLIIGKESLCDSTIILAAQAADIRGDNGQIAGTFVLDGELIGKGEAKAGYCSIINGELSIGVADATPMLEQTLINGGYFFRQYPLVVGGQIVENKPKGRAIRKALAEIGGKICIAISREKLTFHDFSRLLIEAGARNAIYLVGASSYGFYVNEQGEKTPIGKAPWNEVENVSYIIWEQR